MMQPAPEKQDEMKDFTPNRHLQPPDWPQPRGYANGIMAKGHVIVTGGVVGWDEKGVFADGFVPQTSFGGPLKHHLAYEKLLCPAP